MPTYEYACSSCGNAWEEIQKITAPPVELCPACQKATAKRQISGGNFILKGGGWYSDLYSSTPKKGTGDSKSGEGSAAGSGESKSESKTEKTESAPKTSEPKKDGGSSSGSTGSSGSSGSTKSAAE